jgi:hypothetical protein
MKDTVISLCDYTGIMVGPWVNAGYRAVLLDPQHEHSRESDSVKLIAKRVDQSAIEIRDLITSGRVAAVFAFPVCTDLAVSGTARWATKRAADRNFQAKAMQLVHECRMIGELSGAPWMLENPVSAVSSIWRKPDHTFHPNEYGGYLPEDDAHPMYPDYFPPRDAYGKKTCIWSGGGFVMPAKRQVDVADGQSDGQGQSKAHNKLGGRSLKTKNIRSATPRGFAQAVFQANGQMQETT